MKKRKNHRLRAALRVQYRVRKKIEKLLTRGKMNHNSTKGYVKTWRSSVDNDLYFAEEFSRWQAWQDLILLANYSAATILIRGVEINLDRGQLAYAIKTLSHRWGWSPSKVDNFLKFLQKREQIEYQKTNVTTIVTVKNYDKYQGDENQNEDQNDTRTRPKRDQNNTDNKNKKNKNNIYGDFLALFIEHSGKKIRVLDKKTEGQINARLSEGYTMEDFATAIKNCKADKYHIENPQYLTPEFITRADKLQKYLNTGVSGNEAAENARLAKVIFH